MTKNPWTVKELNYLKETYTSISNKKEIAAALNRTLASVLNKAKRMGLQQPHKLWSIEEDNFLLEHYPLKGNEYCASALGRTKNAVQQRSNKLNIRSLVDTLNNSKIISEWLTDNQDIELLEPFSNDRTKILVKHVSCNHTWKSTVNQLKKSRKQGNSGCPKCSTARQYSGMAISWLNSLSNPNIQHAENGGESLLLGRYRVDGYDPITETVYEFHGDKFHGNLDLFDPEYRCHPFDKSLTAEELWEQTFNRMRELAKHYTVVYIWENDYKNGRSYEIF